MTSDFDKLKDEAEKEAQQHPQQVKEGEQAAEKEGKEFAEKEFGGGGQPGDDSAGGGQQGQGQGGQGQ
jgi:hypothetical protein